MKNICIFASGSGTNADRIMAHFKGSSTARVVCVVCDKPGAGVVSYAEQHGVSLLMINNDHLEHPEALLERLREMKVDLIVLAGFLRLLPEELVKAFPDHIINIHPSLLPNYGGRGMYGERVHKAVIDAREEMSGITIHFVNEHYDEGRVIFQATCPVLGSDTPSSLAARIHQLEHEHYPEQIELLLHD